MSSKPVLVTGGAGFIGCNVADRLASDGNTVIVFDALMREGVERNLNWLRQRHGSKIVHVASDVRDRRVVDETVRECQAVFHLAAQVAVTTSLADPVDDFEINIQGALNVLEAARRRGGRIPVIFASTNKVYGDLGDVQLELVGEAYRPVDAALRVRGVNEQRPLDFHTPYGCSKGAADQYVLDYARSYDLPTCVLRMSCIYGPRQMGTEDQGWVAHFLIRALNGEPITLYGDGRQVRDILNVADTVDAYMGVWKRIEHVKGRAFNLGGGPANAVSLVQLLGYIEELIHRKVEVEFSEWRAGDQRYYVSDPSAIRRELGLSEPLDWRTGVAGLAKWLIAERGGQGAQRPAAVAVG